jgi:hypothetical protein
MPTHGTATPQPNPERDRFNALAAHVGPDATCEVEDTDGICEEPARFAVLMLGTTSLDALNLECLKHATRGVAEIDKWHDAGDTFAFVLLPRY